MVNISAFYIVLTVIIAIILFAMIIGIHEFGHFITAKKFGVKVNEFALGMGPKLVSWRGKKNDWVKWDNPIPIRKRKITKCILLSIVTFGVYYIYWKYLLVKNIRSIQENNSKCTGEMLCFLFVPFYSLYWWFTRGKIEQNEFSNHGYSCKGSSISYLLFSIFALEIVSMAIMQEDFNSLVSETVQPKDNSDETLYSLRLIPIGGYCAMEGEDEDSDDERALNNKKWWQRGIILAAGAFMNIVLGIVFMFVIQVQEPYYASTQIAYLVSDSTSMSAGIQLGDDIYSINGYRTHCATDISFALSTAKDGVIDIAVKRDGQKLEFNDLHMPVEDFNGTKITRIDFKVKRVDKNVWTVISNTFTETYAYVRMIYSSIIMMVTGRVGFNEVSGPVGMASAIGQVAEAGFKYSFMDGLNNIINFMALITVNLGIFNLLPLPALDGGRLLFVIIEGIRRKPIDPEKEGIVHLVGFALLILLMIIITVKDVWSLF